MHSWTEGEGERRRRRKMCMFHAVCDIDSFYWRNECRKHCCWYCSARPLLFFSMMLNSLSFVRFSFSSVFFHSNRWLLLKLLLLLYSQYSIKKRGLLKVNFSCFPPRWVNSDEASLAISILKKKSFQITFHHSLLSRCCDVRGDCERRPFKPFLYFSLFFVT